MVTFIRTIAALLVLLVAAESSSAKSWRGIVPLRSTRADVVRLLNQCADLKEACRFTLEKERVHILFSGGLQPKYGECAARLAPDTVMFIEVEPRVKLKFSDLHLDKRKVQTFNPSAPFKMGLKGYRSADGLVIMESKGKILQLDYIADQADRHQCASYYEQPESFVQVIVNHYGISSIEAPDTIRAGERLAFSAYANINDKRGYDWSLSVGKIVSGQYTQRIMVDTTGLAGQMIVATAEICDGFGHCVTATRSVGILEK
jgi:hypothetical protein